MSELSNGGPPTEMPPQARLLQLVSSCFALPALHVAAKLGIAELLFDGPRSAAELASMTGMHEHTLYRVLRALASIGVFSELDGRKFENTPTSDTLRRDAPNSTLYMTLWMLTEPHWRVYGDLFYSVQTGKTNWDKVHGEPVFNTLFETDRELGDIFNKAMTSLSRQTIPAILDAYDFSRCKKVVDIAGGHGHLLATILEKYPALEGVLFEFPPVLVGAPAMMESHGVTDRAELVGGDFCTEIPVVADVYLLKHIVHDWYDDKCEIILGNIRRVMPDDAKVLIIDAVIPGPNEPHFAKFLDLEMLMLPGGMERDAGEFESLLKKSGFRMTRILPTHSPVCIVEAVKA